jgi:hypothetical protein
MRKWLWVLLSCLCFTHAHAESSPGECTDDALSYDLFAILDSEADPAIRTEHLRRLTAQQHCEGAKRSLGLLYRHGPDLPGNLLARDGAKARELLLGDAEAGYTITFADLAEMALAEGQAREAMKWTQVYLYLVKQRAAFRTKGEMLERSGYNADLLLRAQRAWRAARPRLAQGLVVADLNAYLDGRETAILAAINARDAKAARAGSGQPDTGVPRVRKTNSCDGVVLREAGYASYLVQVLPDGRVARAVVENFSPSPAVAEALRTCTRAYEFHPFDGPEPEVVRIPVFYGYYTGRARISK